MKRFLSALVAATLFASASMAAPPSSYKFVLKPASATACTSIQTTVNGSLIGLVNTGAAQTVFLTLYDEGATPTCAAADIVYGDGTTIVLGAGQVLNLNIPVGSGLAYKLSGAVTGAVLIIHN